MNCDKCGAILVDGCNYLHVCPQVWQATTVMESWNGDIACEPFPTASIEKEVKTGFATAKQKVALTPLNVVFGTDKIPEGSMVYVPGDGCMEAWGKRVFEIEGKRIIMVPLSVVKIVRKVVATPPPTTPTFR